MSRTLTSTSGGFLLRTLADPLTLASTFKGDCHQIATILSDQPPAIANPPLLPSYLLPSQREDDYVRRRSRWRRRRRSTWRRRSSGRATATSGTPTSPAPPKRISHTAVCRCGAAHASPTCFAGVLSTTTCQDTCAAPGTCHVAGGAARADAQKYASRQRCSAASAPLLGRPGSCCRTSSTFRRPSATTASSASCSSSSSWPASAPLSPASSATSSCRRRRGRSPAYLTWSTGRSAPVCRRSIRWRWTRGMASWAAQWRFLRCSRCRACTSRPGSCAAHYRWLGLVFEEWTDIRSSSSMNMCL